MTDQSSAGMSRSDISRIEQSLFFEPPDLRARLMRFTALIIFASIIASGGLITDSVASVIGAMIVAPLMTPIMGMVVALVIGSTGRFTRSAILVAAGIGLSIGIGWLMSAAMPYGWNPVDSAQVMARTSPRLMDLIVALASGGAGAYALSRSDVADALPGVAIAISLVPPLNAAGILLASGENDLARGALLLFTTNFVAILFAGTVTFILMGLATGVGRSRRELQNAIVAIVVVLILVAIPLRANSRDLWTDSNNENRVREITEQWLTGTDYQIDRVTVDDENVTVFLAGSDPLPPSDTAIAEIRDLIGEKMVLQARIVDVRNEVITGDPNT